MKNKYYILGTTFCGLMSLGLTSCDNDAFLDVEHYNTIDPSGLFEKNSNAVKGINGVYDMMYPNDDYDGDWGFKPNLFTGCHPTIDTQATGWDKNWNSQAWNANSSELLSGWKQVYAGIMRANDYLDGLEKAETNREFTEAYKTNLSGQAHALRGFFYHWLATTFGRVPMLEAGENYVNTPTKKRAETYTEMWNFIISDFEQAAKELQWTPMDNEYGRATKGMALAYLGDSYMWKAYRLTDGSNGQTKDEAQAKELYKKAAECFKQILDSKTYKLNESFTTLWDPASAWGPETIWCEQLDEGKNWGQWNNLTSKLMLKWYTACPENGGWGSLFLSWEWYSSYEKGDKRRDGSCYTGAVLEESEAKALYEKYKPLYSEQNDEKSPIYYKNNPYYYARDYKADAKPYNIVDKTSPVYGNNPYLQERLGHNGIVYWTKKELDEYHENMYKDPKNYPDKYDPNKWFKPGDLKAVTSKTVNYHFTNGEWAPAIWSSKMWRTASADYKSWGDGHWSPTPIYWKRLPNVMLDYAECLFRTEGENSVEAWKQINELRKRAFGKLEDGNEKALTTKYLPYYNSFAEWVGRDAEEEIPNGFKKKLTSYPIPFGSNGNNPEDAKTYYTTLKAAKGFTSPVWKVAVNEERRKEFNCEWTLRPDMQRSGYMADHVAHNYPKRPAEANMANIPWTTREYEYDDSKMDMPIPQDEILKNKDCDQNPGY